MLNLKIRDKYIPIFGECGNAHITGTEEWSIITTIQ